MRPDSYASAGGYGVEPGSVEGHPLIGTRWASKHYPVRVVMDVAMSRDGRLRARLTNNIPGMTTWRVLDSEGEHISGHWKIADADPVVALLASQVQDMPGIDSHAVAQALRWPAYDWPGCRPRYGRAHDEVSVPATGLAAIGHSLHTLTELVRQAAMTHYPEAVEGEAA